MTRTEEQIRAAKQRTALREIIAFIEEQNKKFGTPRRGEKINVHFLGPDVREVYLIAKAALK